MRRMIAITRLVAISLLLAGCTVSSVDNDNATLDTPTASCGAEAGAYIYLTEESSENLISVQIPVVATENAELVNACIKECVYYELQRWLPPETCHLTESETPVSNIEKRMDPLAYSAYYLQISGGIAFENEERISLVFKGFHNQKYAAHPNAVLFTVNVDIHTAERIGFADIYAVDEDLYAAFLQHADAEFLTLNVFEKTDFIEGLAHEPEKEFYSYFTPTHVVISYPVAHAIGDYIEVDIPYAEVKRIGQSAKGKFLMGNDIEPLACEVYILFDQIDELYHYSQLVVKAESDSLTYDLSESGDGSYADALYVCDIDGDRVDEIIVQRTVGMTGGAGQYISQIFRIENDQIVEIFYSSSVKKFNTGFSSKMEDNYGLVLCNRYTNYEKHVDIGDKEYLDGFYNEEGKLIKEMTIWVDSFCAFSPLDVDHDGVFEIRVEQYTSLYGHSDYLGTAVSILKYRSSTKEFEVIETEFIP